MEKTNTLIVEKIGLLIDYLFDPINQLPGIFLGSFLTLLGILFANKNALKLAKEQHGREEETRVKNLKREKLEELYVLIAEWSKVMSAKTYSHAKCMNGDITYDDYLAHFIAETKNSKFDLTRLELLKSAYAPEINNDLDFILKYRIEHIEPIEIEFRKYYDDNGYSYTGEEREKKIGSYSRHCKIFEELADILREKVGKKITQEI